MYWSSINFYAEKEVKTRLTIIYKRKLNKSHFHNLLKTKCQEIIYIIKNTFSKRFEWTYILMVWQEF